MLSIALLFACTDDKATDSAENTEGEKIIDVYLLAGQSNMVGYGPITNEAAGDWPLSGALQPLLDAGEVDAAYGQPLDDVWVHFQQRELSGVLDLGFGTDDHFIGPELSLGHELIATGTHKAFFYKSAVGGTTLGADWLPPSQGGSDNLYTEMISGFLNAQSNGYTPDWTNTQYQLKAFVWLQGWNDQFEDGFVDRYEDNLKALVTDVRADLDAADLPAIIVEGPTLDEALRTARLNAIETLNNAHYVATEDLVEEEIEGNFHFHFNAANYIEVGKRIALSIVNLSD